MSKGKNAKYVPVKQSNTLTYVLGAIAVLVVIVVVIGGVVLLSKKEGTPADQVERAIAGATPVFTAGKADAKATLTFFEDPMCPSCGALESQYGKQITAAIESGSLRAKFFLLSFLNGQSKSGDYSDRAGAALLAIAKSSLPEDQKQKAWLGAHAALFANQPTEGVSNPDHDNATLARIVGDGAKAKGVELPADVTAAITAGKYTAESAANAADGGKLMSEIGGSGTPTVVHNGKLLEIQPDWLTKVLG